MYAHDSHACIALSSHTLGHVEYLYICNYVILWTVYIHVHVVGVDIHVNVHVVGVDIHVQVVGLTICTCRGG